MTPSTALGRLRERLADVTVFASPKARRRFLLHVVVVAALLGGATLLVQHSLGPLSSPEDVRALVRGLGVWGPVALVVLQAAQVVLAPIPGQVLAVGAGYVYGALWGTVYNVLGLTLGSTVAFWLSRRFGRAYVEGIVHEDALERFDAIEEDHARLALFFFFLVPGLPDDLICFVGGLTRIPLYQLVVISVVGRTPSLFLVNVVGDLLGTNRVAGVLLAVALFVASAVVYLNRDRLVGYFEE